MFTFNELNLLKKIELRPEVFLGKKSLELLHVFLMGYSYANVENEKNNGKEPSYTPNRFQQFVMDRYQIYSYYNAYGIIRLQCSSDEEAFDKFYELLDEFLAKEDSS